MKQIRELKIVTDSLLLQTPPQHDYTNPAVELNPKRLAKWLKNLPVLNLLASVKDLLDAVEPCNQQQMPAKTRIRLLEPFHQTVTSIFPSVEDEHLHKLPITGSQRKQIKTDMGKLCATLANGYKILVRDGHRERQDPARQPILALAVYRALQMSALSLLHAYRTYQSIPPFTYLDLHQLYRFAERHNILDTPVVFEKRKISATGVGPLYKQIMLLAVADPFHLASGTAAKLHELLAQYAASSRMETADPSDDSSTGFLIDLDGDSPPIPSAKIRTGYAFDEPRLLDVRPSMEQVQARLEQLHDPKGSAKISNEEANLLNLLTPELEKSRVRKTPRNPVNRETHMAFGIDAIHYYLSRGKRFLDETLRQSSPGIEVRDLESESEARHSLQPWTIINENVNGYMLSSRRMWQQEVRVGDAVGLATPAASQQPPGLTLATIRWMRNSKDARIEIGVEVVPGNMLPVTCTSAHEVTPKFGEFSGLFLPSVATLDLPATLMTPKQLYAPDRMLNVRTGAKLLSLRAGRLVTETAVFDRFEFEILKER